MDRTTVELHLRQAEGCIASSEQNVTRQREIVAEFEAKGLDPTEALRTLANFEETLAIHRTRRDKLRRELAYFGASDP